MEQCIDSAVQFGSSVGTIEVLYNHFISYIELFIFVVLSTI